MIVIMFALKVLGLHAMHSQRQLHRDVKPDNVLVQSNHPTILINLITLTLMT